MRIEKLKINLNKPRFYLRGGFIIDRDAIGDPPVCRPEKEYAKDLLAVLNDKFIDHLPNKPLIAGVKGERIVEEDVLIYKIKGATIALHTMVVALYNYKKQKYSIQSQMLKTLLLRLNTPLLTCTLSVPL